MPDLVPHEAAASASRDLRRQDAAAQHVGCSDEGHGRSRLGVRVDGALFRVGQREVEGKATERGHAGAERGLEAGDKLLLLEAVAVVDAALVHEPLQLACGEGFESVVLRLVVGSAAVQC